MQNQTEKIFFEAVRFHQGGEFSKAESLYREILATDPRHAGTLHLLGVLCNQTGRLDEGIPLIRQAITLNPLAAVFHTNLGIALIEKGQYAEGIEALRQASRLSPNNADAHRDLGYALSGQGMLREAMECLGQALRINPNHAEAYNDLGNVYYKQERLAEACQCFQNALQINPNHFSAATSEGVIHARQGNLIKAEECFRRVLGFDPSNAEANLNLGSAHICQGQFAEGAECFEKTLAIDPAHKMALWNRSILRLAQGDFAGGWLVFHQRDPLPRIIPDIFPRPQWDGSSLEGKTIVLIAEQGLGDTIQFIRYAELVKKRGGRVLLECQSSLRGLLEGAAGVDQVIPQGQSLPPADVQFPLMGLPIIFKTTIDTIPAKMPYLRAEPKLLKKWQENLGFLEGFKIGIVWQGNTTQRDDRQRSVPLAMFAPLAAVPGVRLVSLQVGPGREQLAKAGFRVTDLGKQFDPSSLNDLAAVLPNLDLVISVCTSVAHLTGALGIHAWVALQFVPHWIWLLQGSMSPWYPTLRLFRQTKYGAWKEVFEQMAVAVAEKIKGRPDGVQK